MLNENEKARIYNSLEHYTGDFPLIQYRNSNGNIRMRPPRTLNILKIVSNYLATLTFNESSEINVKNTWLIDELEKSKFQHNLAEYLEPMYALGGIALRPYVKNGNIKLTWALATNFIPVTWDSSEITEADIKFPNSEGYLLESHRWVGDKYVITNKQYDNKDKEIKLPEGVAPRTEFKNLTRPLFIYLKTANYNNIDINSPLGLGVCDNSIDTLTAINDIVDEFNQEIKMGRRKIVVPESMLESYTEYEDQPPKLYLDDDVTIFQRVATQGIEDFEIKDLTTDIRADSYIKSVNHALQTLELEMGVSQGTFNFDESGRIKTATQVVSEDSKTYQLRSKNILNIEEFIKQTLRVFVELGQIYGINTGDFDEKEVVIDFQDGAFENTDAIIKRYTDLLKAGVLDAEEVRELLGYGYRTSQTDTGVVETSNEQDGVLSTSQTV